MIQIGHCFLIFLTINQAIFQILISAQSLKISCLLVARLIQFCNLLSKYCYDTIQALFSEFFAIYLAIFQILIRVHAGKVLIFRYLRRNLTAYNGLANFSTICLAEYSLSPHICGLSRVSRTSWQSPFCSRVQPRGISAELDLNLNSHLQHRKSVKIPT